MVQGPLQHHRALGIHPGAFVQSTAPATAGMQDGVLWVDTSSGPPFALKVWDQPAAVWRDVGGVVSGPTAAALLPPGTTGELLVNIAGQWVVLPPGTQGQDLVMQPYGSALVPQWTDGCCAQVITSVPINPGSANPCGPASDAVLCGAATTIAGYLEQYYTNVRQVLNLAASAVLTLTLAKIFTLFLGALPATTAPIATLSTKQILRMLAALIARGFSVSVAPVLTSTQQHHILQAVRCALPHCPADLTITDAVRDGWTNAIAADGVFVQMQAEILWLLSHIVSLSGWQTLANLGAMQPSTACSSLACGAGRAFQGGAQLGIALTRSFQGGAQYGVNLNRSFTGGAQFGLAAARSSQGGAQRT